MNSATEWTALITGVVATAYLIVDLMLDLAGGMYGKLMAVFFGG